VPVYCLWVAGSVASRKARRTFPAPRAINDSLGILHYAQLTGYLSTAPAATEPGPNGARPFAGSEGPPPRVAGGHARRRRGARTLALRAVTLPCSKFANGTEPPAFALSRRTASLNPGTRSTSCVCLSAEPPRWGDSLGCLFGLI
jgi:hypothetical protein